jgi:hypothetical protein
VKPSEITPEILQFLQDRHLATLTTMRPDGSPHVVAVGFSYDASTCRARVITFSTAQKALNAARGGRAAVSQVDGGRWLTMIQKKCVEQLLAMRSATKIPKSVTIVWL